MPKQTRIIKRYHINDSQLITPSELLPETKYCRGLGNADILINTKDEFMCFKVPKAASASLTTLSTKIF